MENVIASDIVEPKRPIKGDFARLDVGDLKTYENLVKKNKISQILHFGALLSEVSKSGEFNPNLALEVNMKGLEHTLELARQNKCLY